MKIKDLLESNIYRPLSAIAKNIKDDWKNPAYAGPYLDAMAKLDKITDKYIHDDGRGIVLYFLSNAASWRGPDAKTIKAELKAMLAGKPVPQDNRFYNAWFKREIKNESLNEARKAKVEDDKWYVYVWDNTIVLVGKFDTESEAKAYAKKQETTREIKAKYDVNTGKDLKRIYPTLVESKHEPIVIIAAESVEHEKLVLNKFYVISTDGKEVLDGPFPSKTQAQGNCKMHSKFLGTRCKVLTGAEVQDVLGECIIVEGINFAVMQQKIYDYVIKKMKELNPLMHTSYAAELARTTDQFFTTAFDAAQEAFNKAEDKAEIEDNLRTAIVAVSEVIAEFFADESNHPPGYSARKLVALEYDDPIDKDINDLIKKIDPTLEKELASIS